MHGKAVGVHRKYQKKRCTVVMVFCRLWRDDDQTKRTYHLQGCGGDIDVLTRGIAAPQAIVGADAARHHGGTTKTKIISAQGPRRIVRRNSTRGCHAQKYTLIL